MNITLPTGMNLADWSNQVILDLDPYGAFGRLQGDDWQDWGVQLLNNMTLGNALPNPYQFTEWTDWAERLCQSLA